MDSAIRISLDPLRERFGSSLLAAAIRVVIDLWNDERAGKSPPVLTPLMERDLPPFVFARAVEAILTTAEKKSSRKRVAR